jgi:4-amino-4-deoxy-L-arabinose transferase-like glycosyltransferase
LSKYAAQFLLIILSMALLLPGVSRLPVIDRDEAHFAQASRQMLETGNYFQVRFQDTTRFQKPPGINWLQAASVNLVSDDPSAAKIWLYRIPSILGSLLSILFTFLFAKRFIPAKTAFLAAALLASALLLSIETHMAVIDASLLLSVVLMQGALWVIYSSARAEKTAGWSWALLFWLAMTFGTVLKGVTPLVGLLSVVFLLALERKSTLIKGLRVLPGLALFVFLNLVWLLNLNQAEHSNYLMQMLHKDLLPKLQGGHESHGQPPLFHLLLLPITFWPGSLFLWQAGVYAFKNRAQVLVRFLLAWIIPIWIFFEVMPTKLPQYILPTFPAIALLCALAITHSQAGKKPSKCLHILQFLWGVLTVGLALSFVILPYLLLGKVTGMSMVVGISVLTLGMICLGYAWRGHYRQAGIAVIFTAMLSFPLVFSGLLPQLQPLWLSKRVAETIDKNAISAAHPLVVVGFMEPSLVFYLKTHGVIFSSLESLAQFNESPHLLLIDQRNYELLVSKEQYSILSHTRGYNYSKGKWVELLLLQPLPKIYRV